MALPTRNEVPEELTWDLSRIFKSDKDWENAYQNVKNDINDLADLKILLLILAKICMKLSLKCWP